MENVLESKLNPCRSCFRRLTVEQIMTWQKKELSNPLLQMKETEEMFSLQMFRNLLSYTADRKSSKMSLFHVLKYLKLTIHSEQILKDEAYLQVLKQMRGNANKESLMKCWKFLAILSSCYVPSDDIYYLVLNMLFTEIKNNNDKAVVNHANFIFLRLIKTKQSPKQRIPSPKEIERIEYLKQIDIIVYTFSGNYFDLKIESYTTFGELKTLLLTKMDFNVNEAIYYLFSEITIGEDETKERYVDDYEKVCDILSYWEQDKIYAKKHNQTLELKLYLRKIIFTPFDENDGEMIAFLYYQNVFDVHSGKYYFEENEIIALASLQLLNACETNRDAAYQQLKNHLKDYIPIHKLNSKSNIQWIEAIMTFYSAISAYSNRKAKINYINELKQFAQYQTHLFTARFNVQKSVNNTDNITEECFIGIKPNGIVIFDSERNQLFFYAYESIINWGVSRDQLILSISTLDNDIKRLSFTTLQTTIIQAIIEIYCHLIALTPLDKIHEILAKYQDKFFKLDTGMRELQSIIH